MRVPSGENALATSSPGAFVRFSGLLPLAAMTQTSSPVPPSRWAVNAMRSPSRE